MDSEPQELKVLVVGDYQGRLKSVISYLQSMDIKPLVTDSAKDAIEIYRREQADIILLEETLPDMGRLQFCREIRAWDARNEWTSIITLNTRTVHEGVAREIETTGKNGLLNLLKGINTNKADDT